MQRRLFPACKHRKSHYLSQGVPKIGNLNEKRLHVVRSKAFFKP